MVLKFYSFKTKSLLFISSFILMNSLNAKELTFCHEDNESFPWIMKNNSGLNMFEIQGIEKKIPELKVKLTAAPWKRCLEELKENKFDGVFAGSYKADRLENGAYPGIPLGSKEGKPDDSKRTHTSEYALYIKKGANIHWDGSKITGAKKVGAQSGFSIVDLLNKQKEMKNIETVEDSAKTSVALINNVFKGNLDAAAMLVFQADNTIKSNKEFSNVIKLDPPLEKKSYFLILSHKLVKEDPELAKKIWKSLEEVRESNEYKAKIKEVLK